MVKLKKIILVGLMLVIGIGNIFAEDDITIITTTQLSFTGKIANSNIHMYLNQDDNNKLFGTYYYDAYKIDIPVKGYIAPNGVIKLTEYDENGKYLAVFEGIEALPVYWTQISS